jgi:hypothetical protein
VGTLQIVLGVLAGLALAGLALLAVARLAGRRGTTITSRELNGWFRRRRR